MFCDVVWKINGKITKALKCEKYEMVNKFIGKALNFNSFLKTPKKIASIFDRINL